MKRGPNERAEEGGRTEMSRVQVSHESSYCVLAQTERINETTERKRGGLKTDASRLGKTPGNNPE